MHSFSLEADGFYRRDGAHFFPVGVAYRPAGCAGNDPALWARWPLDEIRADVAAMAAAGLNAVRVHAPTSDAHRPRAVELVRICAGAGLATLLVGTDSYIRDGSLPGEAVASVPFSACSGPHLMGHDGLLDPFFHQLLPFGVSWARRQQSAVEVVVGFGGPVGIRQGDTFLRAVLSAARAAGATAFFWAGWRDGGTFADGLLDAAGHRKPGSAFFGEFSAVDAPAGVPAPSPVAVGLCTGRTDPVEVSGQRRLLLARHLMGCAGHETVLVPGASAAGGPRRLLIPGVTLGAADIAALVPWVRDGGELFWHGPDFLRWNVDLATLLGAQPLDWRSARGVSVQAFGERFTLAHFPRDVRAELEPRGAHVLARDQQGLPVLLENRLGRGRVRYMLPLVEDAVAPVAAHPTARDRWASWYRGMLAETG